MRRSRRLSNSALLATACLALAACGSAEPAANATPAPAQDERLAILTSLPIYWPERGFEAALGNTDTPPVRANLEERFALEPLDLLDGQLAGQERLLVAQPRGLSAADNVALDEWVRGGGQLLLVLDPMLTAHSEYALGDPRRPSDVALIPPVLARWGLAMDYDEAQPLEREAPLGDTTFPLALAGALKTTAGDFAGECSVTALAAIAECSVGRGKVTVVADAAFLDADAPAWDGAALEALLGRAFPR